MEGVPEGPTHFFLPGTLGGPEGTPGNPGGTTCGLRWNGIGKTSGGFYGGRQDVDTKVEEDEEQIVGMKAC